MISYLLEVTLYQFILLAVYHAGFKRYTFFGVNRFFLLLSVLISFLLPFISMPGIVQQNPIMLPEIVLVSGSISPKEIIDTTSINWNLDVVLYVGFVVFALLFAVRIFKLYRIISLNSRKKENNYIMVNLKSENEVFSWFNYVFAHNDKLSEETLSHELVHIKQKHSIDIIILEITQIILWFSPVIRWYKHELQLVHEYQADDRASKESVSSYAQLLVNELFQVNELSLVHNFWKVSQIKSRIKMLKKMKTPKIKSFKYLLVLPLLAVMTLQYSCSREENVSEVYQSDDVNKTQLTDEDVYNFQAVDVQPQIKGIDQSFSKEDKYLAFQKFIMKHVKDNFQYPEEAKNNGEQGRVIAQFIIGSDGKVKDVKVLRGVTEELDAEAVRIVKLIPDLEPAQNEGKKVPVSFMLPITFKLQ